MKGFEQWEEEYPVGKRQREKKAPKQTADGASWAVVYNQFK